MGDGAKVKLPLPGCPPIAFIFRKLGAPLLPGCDIMRFCSGIGGQTVTNERNLLTGEQQTVVVIKPFESSLIFYAKPSQPGRLHTFTCAAAQ